ncbi:PEP-CTERM sorting domain-containing protein [Tichowtungia aerotolerans]|uniref:PEP-CTERM sorting domain-containing protein n=1 Tax=Tichowtungia aerotolerans TaxID=2697043 RepID=A0A6P1M611_9BACT|nr:PEP-CTERM sorting domain-containing protein [Tichowtungia aerotolerans]QHI70020.1 PEP-CTERM sorting domain-containing protein [Tichowtungia aerotolerans]
MLRRISNADILVAWDTAGCNAYETLVRTNNYVTQNVVDSTALLTGSAPYGYQNRANTYAVEGQSFTELNENVYVQFSLSAESGYQLTVTGLDLYVARSSTGARSFALRSNQDDFSSNLVEWTVDDDSNTLPWLLGHELNLEDTTVTFRVYMWDATGVQKGYIYDPGASNSITVSGTIAAVPEPATVSMLGLASGLILFWRRNFGV